MRERYFVGSINNKFDRAAQPAIHGSRYSHHVSARGSPPRSVLEMPWGVVMYFRNTNS
jgi:hypothetical protein